MAGLTKEQRAAKAAAEASQPDDSSHLIQVEKDGEVSLIHPTTLAEHKRLGWKEV